MRERERERESAIERAHLIEHSEVSYCDQCKFTANSMQITTLKYGNLENQTFDNLKIFEH